MSRFGDENTVRCSMSPKQSLGRIFFSLKPPFLRGVQRHILGLQCHQRGCNFWLEWLGWINETRWTCPKSRFVNGGPERSSMGPKPLLERVFYSLKSPFWRGVEWHVHGLQCCPSDCDFWLEWFVWINATQGTYQTPRIGDGGHARCPMGPKRSLEWVFISR